VSIAIISMYGRRAQSAMAAYVAYSRAVSSAGKAYDPSRRDREPSPKGKGAFPEGNRAFDKGARAFRETRARLPRTLSSVAVKADERLGHREKAFPIRE
jgi:hypothetical protein